MLFVADEILVCSLEEFCVTKMPIIFYIFNFLNNMCSSPKVSMTFLITVYFLCQMAG